MNVANATELYDLKWFYGKFHYIFHYIFQYFLNVKNKVLNLEDILAHVCPSLANPLEGLLFWESVFSLPSLLEGFPDSWAVKNLSAMQETQEMNI